MMNKLWMLTILFCTQVVAQDFGLIDTDGVYHKASYYSNYDQIAVMTASSQSDAEAKQRFFSTVTLQLIYMINFHQLNSLFNCSRQISF